MDSSLEASPILGNRVTVGAHTVIMGPITVQNDTKVVFSVCLGCDTPAGVLVISKSQHVTTQIRADANKAISET